MYSMSSGNMFCLRATINLSGTTVNTLLSLLSSPLPLHVPCGENRRRTQHDVLFPHHDEYYSACGNSYFHRGGFVFSSVCLHKTAGSIFMTPGGRCSMGQGRTHSILEQYESQGGDTNCFSHAVASYRKELVKSSRGEWSHGRTGTITTSQQV